MTKQPTPSRVTHNAPNTETPAGNQLVLVVLELLVGAIMLLGGAALTFFASNKLLGIVHASLGALAFPAAFGLWSRKHWAWNSALALNIASIAYSTASETLVVTGGLLPGPQLGDSAVGTIVAVLISLAVVFLLTRPGLRG